jgi:hypothetical protein
VASSDHTLPPLALGLADEQRDAFRESVSGFRTLLQALSLAASRMTQRAAAKLDRAEKWEGYERSLSDAIMDAVFTEADKGKISEDLPLDDLGEDVFDAAIEAYRDLHAQRIAVARLLDSERLGIPTEDAQEVAVLVDGLEVVLGPRSPAVPKHEALKRICAAAGLKDDEAGPRDIVNRIRQAIEDDWRDLIPWWKFFQLSAGACYEARWRDSLDRKRQAAAFLRDNPPAIVIPMAQISLFPERWGPSQLDQAPAVEEGILSRLIEQASAGDGKVFRSITHHRLVYWEVATALVQHASGAQNPGLIHVVGGWSELARLIGENSADSVARVETLVRLQAHGLFHFPDGSSGNLIQYRHRPASRAGQAYVEINVPDQLSRGYARRPANGGLLRASRDRMLVPIIPAPRGIGKRETHGPQAGLQTLLLIYMRERAEEMLSAGGVVLTTQVLRERADLAGLPWTMVGRVIDHWLGEGGRLKAAGGGRVTLADEWERERRFIEAAARASRRERAAGVASAKVRDRRSGGEAGPGKGRGRTVR